ncbi:lysosomal cystine transporter family [Lichtheimia corymbifera JMRC:FSU:9682]|uniref:Lysosomal cystine transporter family n=1 Tax=Lichtheimia corymbifera JMRC:FSU:9682 TaxID=1263082 RepID=A0A068RS72_9FUNG|nr:lysosomal cystine transporter family [Lichtheimia corymbifera JMRC:FSU:9682]
MASFHDFLADISWPWQLISDIIGWVYFLAWSISFYPQAILNYRRKSVQGLSMDFLYFNVLGFFCYSVFNLSFFLSKEIQDEYRERNNGQNNLVRTNDVFFAVHAFLISSFTLTQTFMYTKDENQRISSPAKLLICASIVGAFLFTLAVEFQFAMWIDLMYYLSYVKLLISIIKYLPQAWINFRRKSTVGWSIHNILLDFTGGTLSVAQLLLDSYLSGDWSGVSGDPVKFGLGFVSIAFDLLFITQHYILYRDRTDYYLSSVDEERRRLIVEGRVPREEDVE